MKNTKKVYTRGMEDVERVIDHLTDLEKKARREQWLKDNYSKSKDKQKERGNENIS